MKEIDPEFWRWVQYGRMLNRIRYTLLAISAVSLLGMLALVVRATLTGGAS